MNWVKKHLSALLITLFGVVGFVMSFLLTIERIELLKNADYIPPCNINPLLSCGSVMQSPQAEAFGFPNPLLGLAVFAAIITVGVVMLAGGKMHKYFWWLFNAGNAFSVVFVHWLFYTSVYDIETLCPFCMVVWAASIAVFVAVLVESVKNDSLKLSEKAKSLFEKYSSYSVLVVVVWYLAILGLILFHFKDVI